ncbi:MAG: hypothetical protein ACOYNL_08870 [Rickettsiales bacterium]
MSARTDIIESYRYCGIDCISPDAVTLKYAITSPIREKYKILKAGITECVVRLNESGQIPALIADLSNGRLGGIHGDELNIFISLKPATHGEEKLTRCDLNTIANTFEATGCINKSAKVVFERKAAALESEIAFT